jgi:hypothetical protein
VKLDVVPPFRIVATIAPNNATPQQPTIKQKIVSYLCGSSPSDPVIRQMKFGAIRGAVVGGFLGATGGGGLTFGLGAIPGAILGGFVVGTVGAAGGVLTGGAVALGCAIGGVYP